VLPEPKVTVWVGLGELGEAEITTFGCASAMVTAVFFEPVRATGVALSVTTRLTTKVWLVVKVCAEILMVGPGQSEIVAGGTGPAKAQWITAVPSPKFQATSARR
jgi:hypothetical protein